MFKWLYVYTRKYYATCPHCEHQYRARFGKWFFAPNMHSLWVWIFDPSYFWVPWRWLRCPSCKKHSWVPLETEGQVTFNEFMRNTYESFMKIPKYLSEHRDEVIEEFNKEVDNHD